MLAPDEFRENQKCVSKKHTSSWSNEKMSLVPVLMSDARYDVISNRIYESFPNACILYIDEVHNEALKREYEARRDLVRLYGPMKELQLFHGTHNETIPLIVSNGFDPTKNRVGVYGYGTYFATKASYSVNYMKSRADVTYMFLADVIVGRMTYLGKKLPSGTPLEHYTWDNSVDRIVEPTMYTSPYPDGAYPRYVIAFHKNAK